MTMVSQEVRAQLAESEHKQALAAQAQSLNDVIAELRENLELERAKAKQSAEEIQRRAEAELRFELAQAREDARLVAATCETLKANARTQFIPEGVHRMFPRPHPAGIRPRGETLTP